MTAIDWAIVALAAGLAIWGYQHGLIVGALTLAGFVGGAFLGARLAPALLEGGAESPYAPITALMGGVLLGAIVATGMEGLARVLRGRLVRGEASGVVDGLGGAALLAALGLGLAWAFGAVALHTPEAAGLREAVQRSAILRGLNDLLPPSGPILNVLNRIDPRPELAGPEARVGPPDAAIVGDPDVEAAGDSVVRILGTACGLGVAGSGWVAAPGVVVTNAHVVAGADDTTVAPRAGAPELGATAIHFDPRNDVAVLRVDGLDLPSLSLAGQPQPGTEAAVLGYPENGPFTVSAARLGSTETVVSEDAYGRGPVRREMTTFRGRVQSGNSGGPTVDGGGRVLTTVFAASLGGPASGLGVPNGIVTGALEGAGGPVDTGPCAA